MSKRAIKVISLCIAALFVLSIISACGQTNGTSTQTSSSQSSAQATSVSTAPKTDDPSFEPWKDGSVKDSSDLPAWTGKKLNLTIWYAHGTKGIAKQKTTNDVVLPEVERVTGVHINVDDSFDNGDQTYDVKLAMLVAANDLPDIMVEGDPMKLYQAQKAYGITQDQFQKYAPTALAQIPQDTFGPSWAMLKAPDGNYVAMPNAISEQYVYDTSKTVNKDNYISSGFYAPRDSLGYVAVRDDILKLAYPQAHTQKEMEDLYVKQNGQLTKDQLLDVPINSEDDFFQFLRNINNAIKTNNIKEGDKPVQTISLFQGADNWGLMSFLGSFLIGADSSDWNYMSYYDKTKQHVEWGFQQPFFKDLLQRMNQLAIEGVASKEAFVDSNSAYTEKANNGLYAVTYAWYWPDLNQIKAAKKPYDYRKVYFNVPKNNEFPEIGGTYSSNQAISILKGKDVTDADIPQILRYYDYSMSSVGQKLYAWGPKSAGLFDEDSSGNRTFKDADIQSFEVYNNQNGDGKKKAMNYGILGAGYVGDQTDAGTFVPAYVFANHSEYHAAVEAKRVADPNAELSFTSGALFPVQIAKVAVTPDFWNFTNYVDGVKKVNASNKVLNDAMLKCLAASSPAQFEQAYKNFMGLNTQMGTTDDTLNQIDAKFKELNKDYMQNLQ